MTAKSWAENGNVVMGLALAGMHSRERRGQASGEDGKRSCGVQD